MNCCGEFVFANYYCFSHHNCSRSQSIQSYQTCMLLFQPFLFLLLFALRSCSVWVIAGICHPYMPQCMFENNYMASTCRFQVTCDTWHMICDICFFFFRFCATIRTRQKIQCLLYAVFLFNIHVFSCTHFTLEWRTRNNLEINQLFKTQIYTLLVILCRGYLL